MDDKDLVYVLLGDDKVFTVTRHFELIEQTLFNDHDPQDERGIGIMQMYDTTWDFYMLGFDAETGKEVFRIHMWCAPDDDDVDNMPSYVIGREVSQSVYEKLTNLMEECKNMMRKYELMRSSRILLEDLEGVIAKRHSIDEELIALLRKYESAVETLQ